MRRRVLLALVPIALVLATAPAPFGQKATDFAHLVESLSEPGGYFHSDNLVSNESAYLQIVPTLRTLGVKGGVYLGVGPEQSFSYLSEIEPELAIIIDIRRDNQLLHLLFKAMFQTARNRLEYLCLLYGRPTPPDLEDWTDLPLSSLLDYVDSKPADSVGHDRDHQRLMTMVERFGIPLTDVDRTTMKAFHDEFATQGLAITYTTKLGRSWRAMPTNRSLYQATDAAGNLLSYLATEDRWRTVRKLEQRDRLIPVVGDLAGSKAMAAIAAYLTRTKKPISAVYVSNVEQYLIRQGSYATFAANIRALPVRSNTVMIRSTFGQAWANPNGPPAGLGSQRVQAISRFKLLTARPDSLDYWELIQDTVEVPSRP